MKKRRSKKTIFKPVKPRKPKHPVCPDPTIRMKFFLFELNDVLYSRNKRPIQAKLTDLHDFIRSIVLDTEIDESIDILNVEDMYLYDGELCIGHKVYPNNQYEQDMQRYEKYMKAFPKRMKTYEQKRQKYIERLKIYQREYNERLNQEISELN